jgi:hypothetical protein
MAYSAPGKRKEFAPRACMLPHFNGLQRTNGGTWGIVLIRRGIFASVSGESSWKTASLLDLSG